VIEVDGARGDAVLALSQVGDLGTMQDTDAGLLGSVREQHGLEELLVAAMRVLGRRPDRVWACCGRRATLSPRRDGHARELKAGDARGRDDVVRVVFRSPMQRNLSASPSRRKISIERAPI
jgi:hypothetical protein